jgi:DNA-binding CsgD family transcriptional regulator
VRANAQSDLARKTFDAVAAAQQARGLDELDSILGPAIRDLGFDHFVGFTIFGPGGVFDRRVLFGKENAAWDRHYIEMDYASRDPVVREINSGVTPLFWSDIVRRRPLLPEEQEIYDAAGAFGLGDGFLTPIHGPDRSLSVVLFNGKHVEATAQDVRSAAHLLALSYGSIGARLHATEETRRRSRVALSDRQVQCLRWVRHGKSSTDIGDLLGLSSRTVDHYIAEACRKLGVRTRTQAVVEASLCGGLEF